MLLNQTACDLCSAAVAADKVAEHGYSSVTVQGPGRSLVQPLFGPGSSSLDLCPECCGALSTWLAAHKASHLAPPEPAPAPAEPAHPAEHPAE